jgi:hypothetical protein
MRFASVERAEPQDELLREEAGQRARQRAVDERACQREGAPDRPWVALEMREALALDCEPAAPRQLVCARPCEEAQVGPVE